MAYPASLIAYYFVKKGIEEGNPISQMKLQKMVYFAHGTHLALHDQPLIKERIQAWKYGPVIPDIYYTFRFYGGDPITDTDMVSDSSEKAHELSVFDNDALETLQFTWDSLKNISAGKLSGWTHLPGSPWEKHYIPDESDLIIPDEDIASYFKQIMKTNGNAQA